MPFRSNQSLTWGQSNQELEFYPPIETLINSGAPTAAATYKVYRSAQGLDDTPVLTGTATLDSVSTTTDASAGQASAVKNRIPLTSTNSIVIGRRYLLKNTAASGSQSILVIPHSIQSGDSVDQDHDLQYTFASGSTFVGLRHSFVLDSTFASDQQNITTEVTGPLRVRWQVTLADASVHVYWTTFELTRIPLKHRVTFDLVNPLLPDAIWQEWAQQRGQEFQPQINEAYEMVKIDLRANGIQPNDVGDPEMIDRLVKLATIATITDALDKPRAESDLGKYRELFTQVVAITNKLRMNTASGSVVAPFQQPKLVR